MLGTPRNQQIFLIEFWGIFFGNGIYDLFVNRLRGKSIANAASSAIIRLGPRFSQGPMPKHDASLRSKVFFWITTPKHEGVFGGVVRELIHMTFGVDFASASVKEQRQDGIWGAAVRRFFASH